ncbi:hypothetical protein DFH08DRAFT_1027683 [Mycena albidolilacea]|uniref:Uncharacterized protein n=1 Tax=Mycena albidolilacea TaxID=1033008 RepID=A0AAD6ZJC0_9AGAR|nr:hypothetical protein DFH08DRAFT_1027683 [Mycena albidolilacea]
MVSGPPCPRFSLNPGPMSFRPSIEEIYDEADPRGAPPLCLSDHILQETFAPDLPPPPPPQSILSPCTGSPRAATAPVSENTPHPTYAPYPTPIPALPAPRFCPPSYPHSFVPNPLRHNALSFLVTTMGIISTPTPLLPPPLSARGVNAITRKWIHLLVPMIPQPVSKVSGIHNLLPSRVRTSRRVLTSLAGGMDDSPAEASSSHTAYSHAADNSMSNATHTRRPPFNVHEFQRIQGTPVDPATRYLPGYSKFVFTKYVEPLELKLQDGPAAEPGDGTNFLTVYTLNKQYEFSRTQSARAAIVSLFYSSFIVRCCGAAPFADLYPDVVSGIHHRRTPMRFPASWLQ